MRNTFMVDGDTYEVPFILNDIENQDISAAAYAPTGDKYLKKGFFVKGDTSGTLKVITLYQYKENENSTSGLSYRDIYVQAGQWELTPVVAVNTGSDSSNINVGTY